ncbi:chromosome segregation SMC family protein [Sphingomonas mesophila]|uniref:chromosome segregation SMC family protein n=1 Tax=Sphingomonas mesophila TaxID=2303576 RepID=UPI000E581A51|nr:AAA family ATPase [Sphingomonas mesophila]
MKIRRLKLGGFKSFVEPTELRIEPGLTGVVGPNGCGKSNLLEAIRWVMGEGSAKSLRGAGMEDVIFAGTATRPARDFAEVSLLIERSGDGAQPGESEITRRIERGAGSAYRIDGRDVRQKDVALLFADAATGAHSPALVSQGRIGAVIAAKPVERRQLLEEAAGISGLHARRKDAEGKLRAAEANIQRLDELLSDQEARAAALKRQARAAERYRALSDKIRSAEARLLFARWREADHAAGAAAQEARAANDSVTRLRETMAAAQVRHREAEGLLAARRTAANEARERSRGLAHELATARAKRDTAARRLAELGRLTEALAADRAREEALRSEAAGAIAALEEERSGIAARIAGSERDAAALAAELNEAEGEARAAETALATILAREAAIAAERRIAEAALEAARAHSARSEQELARIDEQAAALGDGVAQRDEKAEAEQATEAAARALAEAEAAASDAESARVAAAAQRDQADSAFAAARAALASVEAERKALADALAHSGGGQVEVSAEPGYERALAAALGDDLQAEIGGDGARRWEMSRGAGDPELANGLEPLAAHVRAPAELKRRLAQIGVADTDSGQPLAPGQRLVSPEGRMRRWDGFVAIGGGAAAAERLIRANRLAALDVDLPGLRSALEQAEQARAEASQAVERSRQQGEAARAAAAEAERSARDAARRIDQAEAALERIAAQRGALDQRRADLEPLLATARQALAEAEAALAEAAEPQSLADEVEAARSDSAAANAKVADLRARAATRGRELAADRERDAAALKEQSEWRSRAGRAEERLGESGARAAAFAEERESLEGEPERLDREIAALESANDSSAKAVAQAAAGELEAERELANLQRALDEAGEVFSAAREARAGAVARAEAQETRRAELARECGETFECPPPLLPERFQFDESALQLAEAERAQLERLTAERERIGPVNLIAESELAELEQSRAAGVAERDELQEAIHRLRGSIGSLNREGRQRLLAAFEQVDAHFRSLFTTLFDGGQAHLALVESDDPLEAGLEILAQPPGKRLQSLTLLSGGEQALTAVALIFALFLTNPAPICVLDEVDAPLDDANVDRFCDLLDRMTRETDTRYLIVTHNAVTMSRMDRLYGVTMIERGVSRLVSVDLGGAGTLLAAE